MFKFELGQEAKDKVTGFKGIVVSRCQYMTGCSRCSLQSQELTKEGNPREWQTFDEDMLILVGPGIDSEKDRKRGGPPQLEASQMKQK